MPGLPGNAAHFPLVGLWGQHSLMLDCCDSWGMLAEGIGSSVPLLLNLTPSPPLPSPLPSPRMQALLRGSMRKAFGRFDLLMLGLGITVASGYAQLSGYAAQQYAGCACVLLLDS